MSNPIRLWLTLIALALAGCATPQRSAPLTDQAAAYQRDVATLASAKFEGRQAGSTGNELATIWLADQFHAIGLQPPFGDSYLQPFTLPNGKTAHNVVGLLPGTGSDNRVLIVAAHFDHLGFGEHASFSNQHALHPGADDNASGTAGLLLLAKRYSQRPPSSQPSILFVAFNAEELKMLGSKYFLAHLNELHLQKQNIIAMINMDMIGRVRNDMLYIFGLETSPLWRARIAHACTDAQSPLHLRMFDTANVASDQQPFAQAGIPALAFFTGKHEDYHRVTDTPDKVNVPGAVHVLNIVDALIRQLLMSHEQ